jgi:DNA-directed RNA polymerase specialized sigma24 family protein
MGFTYDEASARLDIPLGTLKGLLREGLSELRALISNESEESSSDLRGSSV